MFTGLTPVSIFYVDINLSAKWVASLSPEHAKLFSEVRLTGSLVNAKPKRVELRFQLFDEWDCLPPEIRIRLHPRIVKFEVMFGASEERLWLAVTDMLGNPALRMEMEQVPDS